MLFHLLTHRNCLFWPACMDCVCQVMKKITFNTLNILWYKFLAQHKYRPFVCGRFLMRSPAVTPLNSCIHDRVYLSIFVIPKHNVKKNAITDKPICPSWASVSLDFACRSLAFWKAKCNYCIPVVSAHAVHSRTQSRFLFKEEYSYKDKTKPNWNVIFLGNFSSLCKDEVSKVKDALCATLAKAGFLTLSGLLPKQNYLLL